MTMYETYYQLKTKPFTLLPDPDFLYLGAKHKMALSLLEYGLTNGSAFIVITGHPGTGKTTLLNRLLDQSQHPWVIGVLSNIHGGLGGLMPLDRSLVRLIDQRKKRGRYLHEFARFLEHEHSIGRRVLLILDEHRMPEPASWKSFGSCRISTTGDIDRCRSSYPGNKACKISSRGLGWYSLLNASE
ncbi:MAG: AAA family ATPase [Nitrospira sp.]|nr:AAA family ATPase [Nitrospira sp.]